jgi:hypothetical protein
MTFIILIRTDPGPVCNVHNLVSHPLPCCRVPYLQVALLEAMVLTLRQRLQEEEQRSAALEQELGGSRQEVAELAAARQELLEDVALLRGRLGDTEARLQQAVARNEGLELQVGGWKGEGWCWLRGRCVCVCGGGGSCVCIGPCVVWIS